MNRVNIDFQSWTKASVTELYRVSIKYSDGYFVLSATQNGCETDGGRKTADEKTKTYFN